MDINRFDDFTKEVLSDSKLEITNPGFTDSLMDKIKVENKKRILLRNITFYSLLFILIDAFILVVFSFLGIKITDLSFDVEFTGSLFDKLQANPMQFALIYFAVLGILIFFISSNRKILE